MIPKEAMLIKALTGPDNGQPPRGKLFIIVWSASFYEFVLETFIDMVPFINVCAGKD